ncbi:MAG: TIM barrel protein [Calditrichia bacterium]
MAVQKSYHSICRWTFHAGAGGFVPANIRPDWHADKLNTADVVRLIAEEIRPRLPENIELGLEVHYDNEVNEQNMQRVSRALQKTGIRLAMLTPGAHIHFAYGGIASMDEEERKKALAFGDGAIELAYGEMKNCWHPELPPTLVLWNGSWGYDLATPGVRQMYQNLKRGVADFCRYEAEKGGECFIAIEPKPNEGHAAMLLPTVASTIAFWRKLESEFGISLEKKGLNKEFGHSEMIGLDPVYDTMEEIDNDMLVHMHVNSQGYNDGIQLGGPGKFDIDNGVRINGMNIAIARLVQNSGYNRWKGHDMQPRPYDNEEQAIDRVVRSILSWEACEQAAAELDEALLLTHLSSRETAQAEDLLRRAVVSAQQFFDQMYG